MICRTLGGVLKSLKMTKKVMRFENKRGPKREENKKYIFFISYKAFYFFIIPFHLHFQDDF
jgi:hypothetical protein